MSFEDKNDFLNFDRSVRRQFRFARTAEQAAFLRSVEATSQARVVTLKKGVGLHRAQIGHGWRQQEVAPDEFDEFPAAHTPERMKPNPESASDGRANAKGIPCLYLATTEKTSALEVRPLIGSLISIGYFILQRDVRIVDCSQKLIGNLVRWLHEGEWTPEEIEKQVWTDINDAFSEPTARADADLEYVPTQIVAETFRLQGYDGIGYKSSFTEEGLNLALFDLDAAKLVRCGLHKVSRVDLDLAQADNPYYVQENHTEVEPVITGIRPLGDK